MSDKIGLDDVFRQFVSKDVESAVDDTRVVTVEYKSENSKVLDARLDKEREDAKYERILRFIGNVVALATLSVIVIVCCYILIVPDYSLDEKKLAQPLLAAVLGGIVGYVFAKGVK